MDWLGALTVGPMCLNMPASRRTRKCLSPGFGIGSESFSPPPLGVNPYCSIPLRVYQGPFGADPTRLGDPCRCGAPATRAYALDGPCVCGVVWWVDMRPQPGSLSATGVHSRRLSDNFRRLRGRRCYVGRRWLAGRCSKAGGLAAARTPLAMTTTRPAQDQHDGGQTEHTEQPAVSAR
jgi:hypothetical protein